MKPQPKNDKQLDILEQQTDIQKLSAELELFIVKATGKNISAMMQNVNGNIAPKDHLDVQRTLDLAKKTAGIVPYYPSQVIKEAEQKPERKIVFEVIDANHKKPTNPTTA